MMPLRAVIYARYSSDNQKDSSIEDQVELCRRYAEARGWEILTTFEDRAISGASAARPSFQSMVSQLAQGGFDVIIAEALDRISRKLSDIAGLFDDLQFHRVHLHTVATGEVTHLHVGLLGTMAQMYLSDLKDKTKRGQMGAILKGRIPAGKAYGYDVVDGSPGERKINPAEGAVINRIFRAFVSGDSPRAIARKLNLEGVPGPSGRIWRDTTIRGQVERGTGILNNTLYTGRLVWNRCSYVKDPRTGKRVARVNPRSQWEVHDVPELRIVDDALWAKAKTRQEHLGRAMATDDAGNALNRVHRRKFLFSGLLECGLCGGGYTIIGQDRYGCATRRSAGTCANDRTIDRHELEHRVLSAVKGRLLTPELISEFVESFRQETIRIQRDQAGRRGSLEAELATVQRKIKSIVTAIEDGHYAQTLGERLEDLERRQSTLKTELSSEPQIPEIALHPNLPDLYARKVAELEIALNDPSIKLEASDALRSLVDRIRIMPRMEEAGVDLEVHGDLAYILQLCDFDADEKRPSGTLVPEGLLSVVAGAGFQRQLLFTMTPKAA